MLLRRMVRDMVYGSQFQGSSCCYIRISTGKIPGSPPVWPTQSNSYTKMSSLTIIPVLSRLAGLFCTSASVGIIISTWHDILTAKFSPRNVKILGFGFFMALLYSLSLTGLAIEITAGLSILRANIFGIGVSLFQPVVYISILNFSYVRATAIFGKSTLRVAIWYFACIVLTCLSQYGVAIHTFGTIDLTKVGYYTTDFFNNKYQILSVTNSLAVGLSTIFSDVYLLGMVYNSRAKVVTKGQEFKWNKSYVRKVYWISFTILLTLTEIVIAIMNFTSAKVPTMSYLECLNLTVHLVNFLVTGETIQDIVGVSGSEKSSNGKQLASKETRNGKAFSSA
ncbi:hypothetical protein BKA69DRAFT_1129270 [Paraphysoderma sedebokerense]|nr:hypothetical protein BKA69DRAFT_1129270 [Paraphysoderma sedebokerense]